MPTVAVIPVKSFRDGMLRLSPALSSDKRASLGVALASHVSETAVDVGLLPLIVTADPDVASWAMTAGFPSLQEDGVGLNQAAQTGVEWAVASDSHWVVIHSDLPLLRSSDLEPFVDANEDMIAPSADGGTSAIASSMPIRFAFGVGSFHHHLPRLDRPRIITTPGLAHDIDSPNDLSSALTHPSGQWVKQHLI